MGGPPAAAPLEEKNKQKSWMGDTIPEVFSKVLRD